MLLQGLHQATLWRVLVAAAVLWSRLLLADALCIWRVPGQTPDRSWQQASLVLPASGGASAAAVKAAAWSPDGTKVITVADTVRVWGVNGAKATQLRVLAEPMCQQMGTMQQCIGDHFATVTWSLDGSRVAFGGEEGKVLVWAAMDQPSNAWYQQGKLSAGGHIRSLRWSPDSHLLAICGENEPPSTYDLTAPEASKWHLRDWTLADGLCQATAWKPDMTELAFGTKDGVNVVCNDNWFNKAVLKEEQPTTLTWANDGTRLACGSRTGQVSIWHPLPCNAGSMSGPKVTTMNKLHYKGGPVEALDWAADGTKMAVGGSGGTLEIWYANGMNASDWHKLAVLGTDRPGSSINTVAFSRDSASIAFGGVGTVCEVPEKGTPMKLAAVVMRVATTTAYSVWALWVVLALVLLLLMLVSIFTVLYRYTSFTAAALVTVSSAAVVAGVWVLVERSSYIGHVCSSYVMPILLPGLVNFVLNIGGHIAFAFHSIGTCSVAAYQHIRGWLRNVLWLYGQLGKAISRYTCIGPEGTGKKAVVILGDAPTLATKLLGEVPVQGVDPGAAQVEWARALLEVVNTNEELCFRQEPYLKLKEVAEGAGTRISALELLLFVPAYLRSAAGIFPASFKRRMWLDKARRQMQDLRDKADDEIEHNGWQLLIDQYDWYKSNDLYLVDVLAFLAKRFPRAAPAVRLWQALDRALSYLPRLMFKPMWIPSPSRRAKDLASRLRIVNTLAAGGEVEAALAAPPLPESARPEFAGNAEPRAGAVLPPRHATA